MKFTVQITFVLFQSDLSDIGNRCNFRMAQLVMCVLHFLILVSVLLH